MKDIFETMLVCPNCVKTIDQRGTTHFHACHEHTPKTSCEGCEEEDCQFCCDHEPDADEGWHCLNCGKDCSEDVLAAAYDYAKGRAKDGY